MGEGRGQGTWERSLGTGERRGGEDRERGEEERGVGKWERRVQECGQHEKEGRPLRKGEPPTCKPEYTGSTYRTRGQLDSIRGLEMC